MAPVLVILKALGLAIKRELGTFQSIGGNNFILFIGILMLQPQSAEFLLVLLGLLLIFPLSSDPLTKIPPARLALWPLSRLEWLGLRLASIALSPLTLIALLILLRVSWQGATLFIGVAIAAQLFSIAGRQLAARAPQARGFLHIPSPPGLLGPLIRHNVREMLTVLDSYLALLLSIGGAAFRFLSPHPDPAAFPILAILVPLALSTYAQCLFCLDGSSGLTRYRLLPLRGRQILLAKNIAFLSIVFVLVIPLNVGVGLTFAFAVLAIGNYTSVHLPLSQRRWRFTGGRLWPTGVVQLAAGTSLGLAEQQNGIAFFAVAFAAWLMSLLVYGRDWDRQTESLNPH